MTPRLITKFIIGRIAGTLFPHLSRAIDANENTNRAIRIKRAILFHRIEQARRFGDDQRVEAGLLDFWRKEPGNHFHANHINYRFELFRKIHSHLFLEVAQLAAQSGNEFSRLVEIGCGDGQVLAYAADEINGITAFIGIDINASAIERAEATVRKKIKGADFVVADACNWLEGNAHHGTILLSYGGVLEYFSQASVSRLLRTLVMNSPAMIVLVEPVALTHDLCRQHDSIVFGPENSFSHNHESCLREAGMDVVYREEVLQNGVRWMLVIGLCRAVMGSNADPTTDGAC